ncbi:MAG: VCBS repeat-containing protein, partial [Chitinophagales bacterium]|nr:VCBS repeat-containing protein [Chitinophagales bacterium]
MRKLFVSALFSTIIIWAHAQNPFIKTDIKINSSSWEYGSSTFYLDLDGDLDLDVIYLDRGPNTIEGNFYTQENLGDFKFANPKATGFKASIYFEGYLTCGDYNNDGLLDFFNNFKIYQNKGNFNFELKGEIQPQSSIYNAIFKEIDLNNDQLDDFIFTNLDSIIVYLSNGDFSFSRVSSYTQLRVSLASFGDIDNDSLPEIFSEGYNQLIYCKNLGNGMFGRADTLLEVSKSVYTNQFLDMYKSTISVTNMDEDADNEIVFASDSIFIADKGSDQTWQKRSIGIKGGNSFQVIDIDNNGWQDIIGVDSFCYLQTASNWEKFNLGGIPLFRKNGNIFADINNDSIPEYITRTEWYQLEIKPALKVLRSGSFTTVGFYFHQEPLLVHPFQDMDKDGDLDIACNANYFYKYPPYWIENIGASRFAGLHHIKGLKDPDSLSFHTSDIEYFDMNNDGNLDFINLDADSLLTLYEYDSLNHYHYKGYLLNNGNPISCRQYQLSDIDKDGLTDLVGLNRTNFLFWQRNLGNGLFGSQVVLGNVPQESNSYIRTRTIIVQDIDNDADVDIFTYECFQKTYDIFRNDGTNSFAHISQIMPKDLQFGIQNVIFNAFDYNLDGYLDIFFEGYMELSGSYLMLGSSSGFGAPIHRNFNKVLDSYPDGYSRVYPTDYDNDGDIDLMYFVNDATINYVINVENTGNLFETYTTSTFDYRSYIDAGAYVLSNTGAINDMDNNQYPNIFYFNNMGIFMFQFNQAYKEYLVQGNVFLDMNNNTIYDSGDKDFSNILVTANEDGGSSITSTDGKYIIVVPINIDTSYVLHCKETQRFKVRTGFNDKWVKFPGSDAQTVNFPMVFKDSIYDIDGAASLLTRRCSTGNTAEVVLNNFSYNPVSGQLALTLTNVPNPVFSIPPDSIRGVTYYFNFFLSVLDRQTLNITFINPNGNETVTI